MSMPFHNLPNHLTVGLILILAACASEPVNFHTLVPPHDGQAAGPAPGMVIRVDMVTVPPQMDRTQIVVRHGRSGLRVLETEWWGATLADEIQSALTNLLNKPTGGAGPGRTASLMVDVQRFDSVLGEQALLDVKWRLKPEGTGTETRCHTVLSTPTGDTLEALVNAHQANLATLAAVITEAGRGGGHRCPGGG